MKETKLISLLKTFTKDEFRQLGKFVRSPFFNSRKDAVNYYSFLKRFYPPFDNKRFTNENIFSAVYPGRKYNSNEMMKLNSYMYLLACEYLKHQPEAFDDDYKLLNKLVERKLEKPIMSLYNKLNNFLDNEADIDNMTFMNKIYLQNALIHFNLNRDRQKDICSVVVERGKNIAIQSLLLATIQYRDMKMNFNAYNYPYEDSFANKYISSINFEKVLSSLEYENNRIGRYLEYYFNSFLMLHYQHKKKYYMKTKSSFRKIKDEVNQLERHNYIARIHSYAAMKINEGKFEFIKEILDAFREYFDRDDVFENNIIPVSAMRSCVQTALLAGDLKFVQELYEKYSDRVNKDYREDVKRLTRASYFFTTGEFKKIPSLLRNISQKYPAHKLDVKQLYLKTYFEMNEFEKVYSFADSFRHFLNNHVSISENAKNKYRKLIDDTIKICELTVNNDKEEAEMMLHRIESDSGLMIQDKIWLAEKLKKIIR